MRYVANSLYNPFDLNPPCEEYVPGYGDANAHFHVIGDHPGVHGGKESKIPFTEQPWSARLFDAFEQGGLVSGYALETDTVDCPWTFFSYLNPCVTDTAPTDEEYGTTEPFFDAELRAITAHVLFPVGTRATTHVLRTCTSQSTDGIEMDTLHATEISGSGWLILPIKEPAEWTDSDEQTLVDALTELLASDYQQVSDLTRFLGDAEPYSYMTR